MVQQSTIFDRHNSNNTEYSYNQKCWNNYIDWIMEEITGGKVSIEWRTKVLVNLNVNKGSELTENRICIIFRYREIKSKVVVS